MGIESIGAFGLNFKFPSDKKKAQTITEKLAVEELKRKNQSITPSGKDGRLPIEVTSDNYDILNTGAESQGGSGIEGMGIDTFKNPELDNARNTKYKDPGAQLLVDKSVSAVDEIVAGSERKQAFVESRINSVRNDPFYGPAIKRIQDSDISDESKLDQLTQLILLHDSADKSEVVGSDVDAARTRYEKDSKNFEAKHTNIVRAGDQPGFMTIGDKTVYKNPRSALSLTMFNEGDSDAPILDTNGGILYQPRFGMSYADTPIVIGVNKTEGEQEVTTGYLNEFENITNGTLTLLNHRVKTEDMSEDEAINQLLSFMKSEIFTADGGVNQSLLDVANTDDTLRDHARYLLAQDDKVVAQLMVAGYEKYKEEAVVSGQTASLKLSFEEYTRIHRQEMDDYMSANKSAANLRKKEKLEFANVVLSEDTLGFFDNSVAAFNGIVETYNLDYLDEKLGINISQEFGEVLMNKDAMAIVNFIKVLSSEAALAHSNIPVIKTDAYLPEGETFPVYKNGKLTEGIDRKPINQVIAKEFEDTLLKTIIPFLTLRNRIRADLGNQTTTINTDSINLYAGNVAKVDYYSDENASKIIYEEMRGKSKAAKEELIKNLHPGIANAASVVTLYEALGGGDTTTVTSGTTLGIGDTTGMEFTKADVQTTDDLDTDVTDDLTPENVTVIATAMSAQIDELTTLGIDPVSYLDTFLQENGIDPKYKLEILTKISYA